MLIRGLIFAIITVLIASQNILTTVDFIRNVGYTSNSIPQNFVGLSLSFSQVFNDLSNVLLRAYIRNSYVYSSPLSGFRISMKMQDPKGYKYDCNASSQINPNATCIRDLKVTTDITNLNSFTRASIVRGSAFTLGMDMEFANFSDNNYLEKIYGGYNWGNIYSLMYYSGYSAFLQVYDQADQFQAKGIRQKFTPTDFNEEAQIAYFSTYYYLAGPGLSISSSKEWMDTFNNWTYYGYGTFTVYAQPFTNVSDVTIPNLLNQKYYRPYLQSRLSGTTGTIDPLQQVAITDLRIVGGDGVAGVTDTMAAAIWALDFAMQSALFGLRYVLFNNDFNATNVQSPLGSSPNFTPRAIYYGMLMMSLINYQAYSFTSQTVTAGTSGSIKVYGFYFQSQQGFLLINKDTNESASGVVQINAVSNYNMTCMYMTASDLSSKNITIAGYSFAAGNASVQGSFALFNYTPDDTGYKIPLNYAQAAYCYTIVPSFLFPKDVSANEMHYKLLVYFLVLLIFLTL